MRLKERGEVLGGDDGGAGAVVDDISLVDICALYQFVRQGTYFAHLAGTDRHFPAFFLPRSQNNTEQPTLIRGKRWSVSGDMAFLNLFQMRCGNGSNYINKYCRNEKKK